MVKYALFIRGSEALKCFASSDINKMNLRYSCRHFVGRPDRDDTLLTVDAIYGETRHDAATQSRRDDTLLTVDFNLRKRKNVHARQSPAGTTLCRSIQVSSLRDFVKRQSLAVILCVIFSAFLLSFSSFDTIANPLFNEEDNIIGIQISTKEGITSDGWLQLSDVKINK